MVTRDIQEENTANWGTISSLSWGDMWIPRDRREKREVAGTKDRGLGGCGTDGPELVHGVWSECKTVEQTILMQGLGIVQEEGMADGVHVPDAGD